MNKPVVVFMAVILIIFYLGGCAAPDQSPPVTNVQPSQTFTLSYTLPPPTLAPTSAPTRTAIPATPAPTQIPRVLLPVRGVYANFDRRGWESGYYPGYLIRHFKEFDEVVGHTVEEEVGIQLDEMAALGINTLTFELRSSDPNVKPGDPYEPPVCGVNPDIGLIYPKPAQTEIDNLVAFFDLAQSKGMKVFLRLVNTHMEEQPPVNNQIWLGTILSAIKDHPAFDLVLFEGAIHTYDFDHDGHPDACGGQAEPALWEGPSVPSTHYITWAIGYAHSLGLPYRKLSAEAIVADFRSMGEVATPDQAGGHFWNPVIVLKGIFDDIGIPDAERTYALSFYEHRKCRADGNLPCPTDAGPHAWTVETARAVLDIVGRGNGARVVAPEMGNQPPVEPQWTTAEAFESLVWIMQAEGIDGGCLWRWSATDGANQASLEGMPVKLRGGFEYTEVRDMLAGLYTLGTTDDLPADPPAGNPAFTSVEISPEPVKPGDEVTVSATLGRTHILVDADLSALGVTTGLVTLRDLGDGTYQGRAVIPQWSETTVGAKQVRLRALDYWSRPASTTTSVQFGAQASEVDAVPPDDMFDGATIDPKKWSLTTYGGGTAVQDGALTLSASAEAADSSAEVVSVWTFPGDFDVRVHFEMGDGWAPPAVGHLDGAALGVMIEGNRYQIARLLASSDDSFHVWSASGAVEGRSDKVADTGRLRLVRRGATLTLLYEIGGGWQEVAHGQVPEKSASIYLSAHSVGASLAFGARFDDFRVGSGVTTYRP